MERRKVYLHASLAKQRNVCWLVNKSNDAKLVQLTPFIIRYMLISGKSFVLGMVALLTSGKPPTLWWAIFNVSFSLLLRCR
jgi:hypothetical protein